MGMDGISWLFCGDVLAVLSVMCALPGFQGQLRMPYYNLLILLRMPGSRGEAFASQMLTFLYLNRISH